jgi:hypothetical protein
MPDAADSERSRPSLRGLLLVATAALGLLTGCQPPTPPTEAPRQYDQLVRQALARAEAQSDTTIFWLRNTGNAQARSLMLELGVDYLRYDRATDVLCAWSGEGLWPARGYVTSPVAESVPDDSVGMYCDIEGDCSVEVLSGRWGRFRCE